MHLLLLHNSLGAMIGTALLAYLHTLDPFAIEISPGIGLRWYGLSYLAGFLSGYFLIRWLSQRNLSPLPADRVGDFVFAIALGTIVGGRLGYCLFYSPDLLITFTGEAPYWQALAIHKGGMASHGGILGIVITCIIFARNNSLPGFHLSDLCTLGGALGIFFGRVANFVNGELPGRPCSPDFALSVKFPQDILSWPVYSADKLAGLGEIAAQLGTPKTEWAGIVQTFRFESAAWQKLHQILDQIIVAVQNGNLAVQTELSPLLTARHPSQLYAALLEGMLVFLVLMLIWRKPQKPGVITGTFFATYAAVRVLSEQFRLPDLHIGYQLFGLTRGQWLSIAFLTIGLTGLWLAARSKAEALGGWCSREP